ncbi:MAG TPA: type I-E CRISPR-associated protein Cse2/CasB [Longimicrobiales bacterium]
MSSHPLLDPPADTAAAPVVGSYGHAVARAVHGVARALEEGAIAPGEAAELRRLKPENPAAPAFWRVLAHYVAPQFGRPLTEDEERRWAVILNAMAYLVRLHAPGERLGIALSQAGFSELRFTRLLRAEGDRLEDTVRNTARFLASKGRSANLVDLARLVLSDGRKDAERVRRNIARDYFLTTTND